MRLLLSAVFCFLLASCSSHPACSSATCAGCCDTRGICQAGISTTTCGSSGADCIACQAGAVCSNGRCGLGASGGGSGAGGGVESGGGMQSGGGMETGGGTGTGGGGIVFDPDAGFDTPQVKIDFAASCPMAPCGGAVNGIYFYTGACIPLSELDSFVSTIDDSCGAGSGHITGVDGGLTGFLLAQGGNLQRKVTGSITVTTDIGGSCVSLCGLIPASLPQGGYTGDCYADGGVCTCVVSKAIHIDDNGAFTTSGNQLTLSSSQRTFDYCVSGGTLTTSQPDGGPEAGEPGVATLMHPS